MRNPASSLVLLCLAALGCLVASCGPDGAEPLATTTADPADALSPEAAGVLLADSWMARAVEDPATVGALLDVPGGDGWLALFHGDLAGAAQAFDGGESASARLGMARVHLAHASSLMVAARLHREAALELARYRRDHRDQVRTGTYEPILAALTARADGVEGPELDGFLEAAGEVAPDADEHLLNGLRGHLGGGSRAGLPDLYADRLAFADAAAEADLERLRELESRVLSPEPDLRDPMGEDSEAGLRFEGLHYDPALLPAVARHHLARAWILGSGLIGPGDVVADAVRHGWGGELPAALADAALGPTEPLPVWTALFASGVVDPEDHAASWGSPDAEPFATRLDAAVPGLDLAAARSSEEVDALLRLVADAEPMFAAALREQASEDGASLVIDLKLARIPADRALRTWMADLVDAGVAVQGKRLGDRTLDANPGSRGGAADSARTRVSYRNDRAFLLDLARCLWRSGQAGAALDLVHPLAEEDPAIQSVKYYLGQLDAAATIGLQGKTSQL